MVKRKKSPSLLINSIGGVDLMVERDAGNEVRILTGNKVNSRSFWRKIQRLADRAMDEMSKK